MKSLVNSFLLFIILITLGCVTNNRSYTPKAPKPEIKCKKIVNMDKDTVWKKMLQGIGHKFFVINNMDKESGFINLSYSGDPENFVEGGTLTYTFSNLRGLREYNIPASKSRAYYETVINGNLVRVLRELKLEGRMNIIISEINLFETEVSVNTRYVLTLKLTGKNLLDEYLNPYVETISFNSNETGISSRGIKYFSNGKFENSILNIVE